MGSGSEGDVSDGMSEDERDVGENAPAADVGQRGLKAAILMGFVAGVAMEERIAEGVGHLGAMLLILPALTYISSAQIERDGGMEAWSRNSPAHMFVASCATGALFNASLHILD